MPQNATALKLEYEPEARVNCEQSAATVAAVVAAHEAPVRAAVESVRWERRGVLQRLTRS